MRLSKSDIFQMWAIGLVLVASAAAIPAISQNSSTVPVSTQINTNQPHLASLSE